MRTFFCLFLPLAALLASSCAASPVRVTLKPSAVVSADADGYFTLVSIAELAGGGKDERAHLGVVRLGRAPLPNQVRRLTPGDVLLKLRQAGFDPETQTVLAGATQVAITLADSVAAPVAAVTPPPMRLSSAAPAPPAAPLIHRGDPLTILIQDGGLAISAKGMAREAGGAGDTIRVHREGVMTDLSVTVLDAQTVQLEL